jgi:hypothetical protein
MKIFEIGLINIPFFDCLRAANAFRKQVITAMHLLYVSFIIILQANIKHLR